MTIRIDISDKLVLTSDPHCFILNHRYVSTEDREAKDGTLVPAGTEKLSPFAFYSTIEQVIRGATQRVCMESEARTFAELFDLFRSTVQLFRDEYAKNPVVPTPRL